MPAVPTCTKLACLQAHEGQEVALAGTLYVPRPKAIDHFKVVLDDGTRVTITRDADPIKAALARGRAGQPVVVRGRIFTGQLPERYGVVARNEEPRLMETSAVTFSDP